GPVYIVESDGVLRYDAQRSRAGGKDLFVQRIANRRDQRVYSATNLFDDEGFGRWLGSRVDLELIPPLAETIQRFFSDIRRREYPHPLVLHAQKDNRAE